MYKSAALTRLAAVVRVKLARDAEIDEEKAEVLRSRIRNNLGHGAGVPLAALGALGGGYLGNLFAGRTGLYTGAGLGGLAGLGAGEALGHFAADKVWIPGAQRGDYGFGNSKFERFNLHPATGAAASLIAAAPMVGYGAYTGNTPYMTAGLAAGIGGAIPHAMVRSDAAELARMYGHRD